MWLVLKLHSHTCRRTTGLWSKCINNWLPSDYIAAFMSLPTVRFLFISHSCSSTTCVMYVMYVFWWVHFIFPPVLVMRCCPVKVRRWRSTWKQANASQEEERSVSPVMRSQTLRSLATWWAAAGTRRSSPQKQQASKEFVTSVVFTRCLVFHLNIVCYWWTCNCADIVVWRLCVWERKTRSTVRTRREPWRLSTRRKGGRERARSCQASGRWCTGKLKARRRSEKLRSFSQLILCWAPWLFFSRGVYILCLWGSWNSCSWMMRGF